MFGLCCHNLVVGSNQPYCDKCNSFVTDREIEDIKELEIGLSSVGVRGGIYIAHLVNFLIKYGNLSFESSRGTKWYSLCYRIDDPLFTDNTITYKSKTTKTFAYNVCWLSEILYRSLVGVNYSEQKIRRIINDG